MVHKVNKIGVFLTAFLLIVPFMHILGSNPGPSGGLKTVVIDPGHGGKDPGAPGPDRKHDEKTIVLNISLLFGKMIEDAYPDVNVVYTRKTDILPSLATRAKITCDNNADLFISVHCNSNKTQSLSGSSAHILGNAHATKGKDYFKQNEETLTAQENASIEYDSDKQELLKSTDEKIKNSIQVSGNFEFSLMFAQNVVEHLAVAPFKPWRGGIHQNGFYLLWNVDCPAVFVETAYLSNPEERKLLIAEKWQKEIAVRLFNAFRDYKTFYDTTVADESDEYYSIQIMGLGRLLKTGDPALKGLKPHTVKSDDSSIYKYVCGRHATKEEAEQELVSVRRIFPDAFIVKVKKNEVTIAR